MSARSAHNMSSMTEQRADARTGSASDDRVEGTTGKPATSKLGLSVGRRREVSRRIDRVTRLPMLVLSVVFLVALALPELVDVSPEADLALETVGWLIWAVFAFELALMTYLAENRRAYLIEHWPDVLTVILPFLRPIRLLRVVILSVKVWSEALVLIRERTLSVVACTSLLCIWAAATLVYMAERGGEGPIQTYPDALWWAVATITTVGYGDVYPKTPQGRGVAFLLMLVGISAFGLLTARISAFFVETDERGERDGRLDEILARLERIEQSQRGVQTPERPAGTPGRGAARTDFGASGAAEPEFDEAGAPAPTRPIGP